MPNVLLLPETPTSELAYVEGRAGALHRLDAASLVDLDYKFDPEGVFSQAEIDLAELLADKVSQLYSFELEHVLAGGEVELRFSLNGGTSWLYWNGAAWSAPASASDWTDPDTANEHIQALPFVGRLLTRVRLTPALDATASPTIGHASVAVRHRGFVFLEDVERALRNYVEEAGSLKLPFVATLAAAATIALPSTWLVASDVSASGIEAFNLTTDPDRSDNLAASLAGTLETLASGRQGYRAATLTLTSPQTGLVEVHFQGVPAVTISNDPTCPSPPPDVLLRLDPGGSRRAPVTCSREDVGTQVADLEALVHPGPDLWDLAVEVVIQSTVSDRVVAILEDAIGVALSRGSPIPSPGGGFTYWVMDYNPGAFSGARVAEGLYARVARVTLGAPRWVVEPATVDLISQVEALVAVGVSDPRGAEGVLVE